MSLALYEIAADIRAIIDASDETSGELTPAQVEHLDALEMSYREKIDSICAVRQARKLEAVAVQAEIDRLQARKRTLENQAEGLAQYVRTTMESLGHDRVDGARFRCRIQKNSAPSVRWVGEGQVPTAYQRIKVELDAAAVIRDWRAGVALPDDMVVAVGHHLRIT